MSSIAVFSKKILITGICIAFLFGCKHSNDEELPKPAIKAGVAKIVGKVINFDLKDGELLPVLSLSIRHPVTAEIAFYQATLNEDGNFSFDIQVECSPLVGFIQSKIYVGGVCIVAGEKTYLEIFSDENNNTTVNMISSLDLTSEDMIILTEVASELAQQTTNSGEYTTNPEDYSKYTIERIEDIMMIINTNSKMSQKAKNLLTNSYKLYFLNEDLFGYTRRMNFNYRNSPDNKDKSVDEFVPQQQGRSYYSFLKFFDLNNPQYLYTDNYYMVLESILNNDIFHISPIKDTPVKEWLKEVKAIIADLIGADRGLFYDIIAANAYAKQFKEENKPLSDKQKENISSYFKNRSFVDILFTESDKIIQRKEDHKSNSHVKINKTPDISKDKLMEAIVSKYKGKVIIVDFWATWCGPCLAAIREMKSLKYEIKANDVTFIYITGQSSPVGIWEKIIDEIDGEHYYLTQEEWEFLLDSLDFSSIPSYFFYDSDGKLQNKISGFPGGKEFKEMINEML